ncbi:hypothetical protein [Cerasicoccus fimbriatus]|uniref:hypothetical protein n=1 Tax=Cerasicoccus fimbriatus TaxID=3014554 RepID=UPI0022B4B88C|nr:hypothetical protein [Cerasicoccus sp. TK19100]
MRTFFLIFFFLPVLVFAEIVGYEFSNGSSWQYYSRSVDLEALYFDYLDDGDDYGLFTTANNGYAPVRNVTVDGVPLETSGYVFEQVNRSNETYSHILGFLVTAIPNPPQKQPFYEASTGQFYNGSQETVSYVLTLTKETEMGLESEQTQIDLDENEWFDASAGSRYPMEIRVQQLVNGATASLGKVSGIPTGEYYEHEMPSDYYDIVEATGTETDFEDYVPPVLDPIYELDRGDLEGYFPEGLSSLDDFQPYVPIDPHMPQEGDTEADFAADNALNIEKLIKNDQMLWEASNRAANDRLEKLDSRQAQRHSQSFLWQQKQLDTSREHLQATTQQTSDLKSEFNESQMQQSEMIDELGNANDKLDALVADSDLQNQLYSDTPGTSQMSANGGAAQTDMISKFDALTIPGGVPDINPGTMNLSVSLGGETISLNPFDYSEFNELSSYIKKLIFWFAFLFYSIRCIDTVAHLSLETLRMKQAKGNNAFAGTGAQITALIAAGLITVALLTVPTLLIGLFDPEYGGLDWFTLGNTNPLDPSGFSSFIEMAVAMVDAFIPMVPIIYFVFQWVALRVWGTAAILGIASLVRFIVP